MNEPRRSRARAFGHAMEKLSEVSTEWAGSTPAAMLALALILGWLLTGPLFHFSDTWQLVINTTTTVVTFLMVFLIQRTQNKSSRAMALKLDELIAALRGASSRLVNVESLSEEELRKLQSRYRELVRKARREGSALESHTIDELRSASGTRRRRGRLRRRSERGTRSA